MAAVTGSFTAKGVSSTFNATNLKSEVILDGGKGQVILEASRGSAAKWQPILNITSQKFRDILDTPSTATDYRFRCTQIGTSATQPTATTGSTSGASGTPGIAAVAGVFEIQSIDLGDMVSGIGDIITITFDDEATIAYTTTGAIAEDADIEGEIGGSHTDSLSRDWLIAVDADGVGTITQTAGVYGPTGDITTIVVGNESGGGTNTNPTDGTGTSTTAGVAVVAAVYEIQDIALTDMRCKKGDALVITLGNSATITYVMTSDIASDDAIRAELDGLVVSDVSNNWTFDLDSDAVGTIAQSSGPAAPVGNITDMEIAGGATNAINYFIGD